MSNPNGGNSMLSTYQLSQLLLTQPRRRRGYVREDDEPGWTESEGSFSDEEDDADNMPELIDARNSHSSHYPRQP